MTRYGETACDACAGGAECVTSAYAKRANVIVAIDAIVAVSIRIEGPTGDPG